MAAGRDSATAQAVPNFVDHREGLGVCQPTAVHGLGVQTLVARKAGAVIHRFTGAIGPDLQQHSLQVGPGRHISDTRFIGYLSHSCAPNSRLDMDRFGTIDRKDVEILEALQRDA